MDLLWNVSDERDSQHSILGCVDREFAIQIGNRPAIGFLIYHVGSDNGQSGFIKYFSGDFPFLLRLIGKQDNFIILYPVIVGR